MLKPGEKPNTAKKRLLHSSPDLILETRKCSENAYTYLPSELLWSTNFGPHFAHTSTFYTSLPQSGTVQRCYIFGLSHKPPISILYMTISSESQ